MKIVTIGAWKGGVGKTTILLNLTFSLVNKNKKILLLDLDPQGNLTETFDTKTNKTINDVFNDNDIVKNINKTNYNNIDIVKSELNLLFNNKIPKQTFFKEQFKKIKNTYDYVLIDTPPTINNLTTNAFLTSDSVILISDISSYSFKGIIKLFNYYNNFCKEQKIKNNINAILISMIDHFNLSNDFVDVLQSSNLKQYLIKPYIPRWTAFKKVSVYKKSLYELKEKKASALYENIIKILCKKKII